MFGKTRVTYSNKNIVYDTKHKLSYLNFDFIKLQNIYFRKIDECRCQNNEFSLTFT